MTVVSQLLAVVPDDESSEHSGFYVEVTDVERDGVWCYRWRAWSWSEGGDLAREAEDVFRNVSDAVTDAVAVINQWGPRRPPPRTFEERRRYRIKQLEAELWIEKKMLEFPNGLPRDISAPPTPDERGEGNHAHDAISTRRRDGTASDA